MVLQRLTVSGVRNLQPVTLMLSPTINLFYGANGSGKTSLLEAIHLLGLARSFRSSRIYPVIAHAAAECTVFGEGLVGGGAQALGVTRCRSNELAIRINGQAVRTAAELARQLPLQLINPDSFRFLEGTPKLRRQLLDWGLFHVEHRFFPIWQSFQQALRQRNAWLRHGKMKSIDETVWGKMFADASQQIDQFRQAYVGRLIPVFERVLASLIHLDGLKLNYYRGWDHERTLEEVLAASVERDSLLGHTQFGPQRADLRFRVKNTDAVEALSRGQQKLVVCALRIAQGLLLNEAGQGGCIYLIDDLPSELDRAHREALCRLLEELQCQVFITCIDPELLNTCWQSRTPVSMFHVEHGHIIQTHDFGE